MPRKARVEGSKSPKPKKEKDEEVALTAEDVAAFAGQAEPKKLANPVPGDDGDALSRIVASFKERFPIQWEEVRLCPAEHSLEVMAQTLRGNG